MKNAHPTVQAAADERQALVQWESLLARLQAAEPSGARLQRVRHAIARGEFHVDARAIAERLIARMLTS
jgi:anti-sigma28 factor (negative regulator of flagellin synthesis)